ncbi:dUTPase [Staphylococcus pseudintermedius]|nr:dUTPase [Staphylococcus pseudintermedius]
MTNTLTVEQLQELLQIQKEFDDRIPTKNPEDTHKAYVEEFFEWYNTIESFKNWKKNKGKPFEEQLDELADMLAFALSYSLMSIGFDENGFKYFFSKIPKLSHQYLLLANILDVDVEEVYGRIGDAGINDILNLMREVDLVLPFKIAIQYYTIDDLIAAYKKKMERNHARQDGTADKEKGYV